MTHNPPDDPLQPTGPVSIQVGNISGSTGVAIGPGARVQITQIVAGSAQTFAYAGHVQNYLSYYVGTFEQPAPFGGRAPDLERLNAWLDDPTAPAYALLSAPAGLGKSTLLAHWVTQLAARADLHVVFFPISLRYNTNRDVLVFAALAEHLAQIHGEESVQAFGPDQHRDRVLAYLGRPAPDGRRLLLVLDGLDEAAWEVGADLFPAPVGDPVRILVAARPLAGDAGPGGWLARLGWDRPGLARSFELAGLDAAGVREVVARFAPDPARSPQPDDLGARLHHLSGGDPLLVRLYLEALNPLDGQPALVTLEQLADVQPGLHGYLDRWQREQRRLWGSHNPLREQSVKTVLGLCATAQGPLTADDLLALGSADLPDTWTLREAVGSLSRLLSGDGAREGYTFSHPRLRDYFAESLSAAERAAWLDRFLKWGAATVQALEAGSLRPAAASAYIVRYYGVHLEHAQAPAADRFALLRQGWLQAWRHLDEGASHGFLGDVTRALAQARAQGDAGLAEVVRATLCLSSVASALAGTPAELLVAAAACGLLSRSAALATLRALPDLGSRVAGLAAFAPQLEGEARARLCAEILTDLAECADAAPRTFGLYQIVLALEPDLTELAVGLLPVIERVVDDEQRATLLSVWAARSRGLRAAQVVAAVQLARGVASPIYRALALTRIAAHLEGAAARDLRVEAYALARTAPDSDERLLALVGLAEALAPEERDLLDETLSSVRGYPDPFLAAAGLASLAPCFAAEQRTARLTEALEASAALEDPVARGLALAACIQKSGGDEAWPWLDEALSVAYVLGGEPLAGLLRAVIERFGFEHARPYLSQAVQIAGQLRDEARELETLRQLADLIPPGADATLSELEDLARTFADPAARALGLAAVAARAAGPRQRRLLAEALNTAPAVQDSEARARALGVLAVQVPGDAGERIQQAALQALEGLSNEPVRVAVIGALLRQSSDPALATRLHALVRAIQDPRWRIEGLGAVAAGLPREAARAVVAEAVDSARALVDDAGDLANAFGSLVSQLAATRRVDLAVIALRAARVIGAGDRRAAALCEVAEVLAPAERGPLLNEALTAALASPAVAWRASVVPTIAALLPPDAAALRALTLEAARALSDPAARAEALWALAQGLTPEAAAPLHHAALESVHAIQDVSVRAGYLARAARCFPGLAGERLLADAIALAEGAATRRALALARVAVHVPLELAQSLRRRALAVLRTYADAEARLEEFNALTPLLPGDDGPALGAAWTLACGWAAPGNSVPVFTHFAAHWSALSQAQGRSELALVAETLDAFSVAHRRDLLQVLTALTPVIARHAAASVIQRSAEAVLDTARWWP